MKVVYKTADGKEFEDQALAVAHEKKLIDTPALEKEIAELLSQVLIKLKDITKAEVENDYISNESELISKQLSVTKSVLLELVKGGYSAEQLLTQYYNSNCY